MKMISGSILCLAGVELAREAHLGGLIGVLILLVGASFLLLTGFGYVVIGAKETKKTP